MTRICPRRECEFVGCPHKGEHKRQRDCANPNSSDGYHPCPKCVAPEALDVMIADRKDRR